MLSPFTGTGGPRAESPTPADAARQYVALGYRVFPCKPREKSPATPHGFKDATADPTAVAAWFDGRPDLNVAMSTEDLLVVDLDGTDHPWADPSLWPPDAPIARTPRGGRHVYLKRPPGKRWRCSAGKLADKVDVRTDGGYIVAAPSATEHGQYAWVTPLCHRDRLPEPPDWLATALDVVSTPPPPTPPAPAAGTPIDSRPGSDFDRRGSWDETGLLEAGWKWHQPTGADAGFLTRPGKETGVSATAGICVSATGTPLFYCFTDGAPPIPPCEPLSKFGVYALLKHGSDFRAAAAALRAKGYGAGPVGTPTHAPSGDPPDCPPDAIVGPAEAPDDPHRLARGFRLSLSPDGEPPRLRHWVGDFWLWEHGVYRRVDDDDVRALLLTWTRGEFERLWQAEHAGWVAAGGKGSAPVVRKITTGSTANVLAALKAICNVPGTVAPPAWLDGATGPAPEDVIVFPNGVLEIGTRTLHRPTAAFFNLTVAGCEYDPVAPTPAAFDKFLSEVLVDPESVEAGWQWLGLLLTAITRYHKILCLIGPRRAGKSTFVKVTEKLVGPASVASVTLAGLAEPFGLAPLLGKSVALLNEARIAARSDTATALGRLLAISGEDAVGINRKNRDIVTARLSTRVVMVTNEMPDLPDAAGALGSRLIVVPFPRSFEGKEDRGLADRLLAELPGILLKALDALDRVRQAGHLLQPDGGIEIKDEFAAGASPVGQFVKEQCVTGAGCAVPASGLYQLWTQWCEQNGMPPGTAHQFSTRLRAAVPGVSRGKGGPADGRHTVYTGVGRRVPLL